MSIKKNLTLPSSYKLMIIGKQRPEKKNNWKSGNSFDVAFYYYRVIKSLLNFFSKIKIKRLILLFHKAIKEGKKPMENLRNVADVPMKYIAYNENQYTLDINSSFESFLRLQVWLKSLLEPHFIVSNNLHRLLLRINGNIILWNRSPLQYK